MQTAFEQLASELQLLAWIVLIFGTLLAYLVGRCWAFLIWKKKTTRRQIFASFLVMEMILLAGFLVGCSPGKETKKDAPTHPLVLLPGTNIGAEVPPDVCFWYKGQLLHQPKHAVCEPPPAGHTKEIYAVKPTKFEM